MPRLAVEDWLHYTQQLSTGQRVRVPHDCGEGDCMVVSKDGNEARAYCHRCGGVGFYREQESLAEQLARSQREASADNTARATLELPQPMEPLSNAPKELAVWFYKMGLSPSRVQELGLYWCPSIGRVVLPIRQDDHVVFWLARSHKRTPKWLGPDVPKTGLTFKYGVGKGDTIVLTEDALSAWKVGQVTEAWSLLGTKAHARVVHELMQQGKRLAVWLDDDRGRKNGSNPGQEAARKIAKTLRELGEDVRNITSDRDPKFHDLDYIRSKL